MAEYRFFGSESTLPNGMAFTRYGHGVTLESGVAALTRYGEVVTLEPGVADALIATHPPALLLPEDLWSKCGITDAELAEFPSAAIHGAAPEDFRAKTKAVRAAFHDYREGLLKAEKVPAPSKLPIAPTGRAVTDED